MSTDVEITAERLFESWRMKHDTGGKFWRELTEREKAGWIAAAKYDQASRTFIERLNKALEVWL